MSKLYPPFDLKNDTFEELKDKMQSFGNNSNSVDDIFNVLPKPIKQNKYVKIAKSIFKLFKK